MSLTKRARFDRAVSRTSGSRSTFLSPLIPISVIAIADTFGGLVQDIFSATLLLRAAMISFLILYVLISVELGKVLRSLILGLLTYLFARALIDFLIFQDSKVLILEIGATLKLLYSPLLFIYLLLQINRGRIEREELRKLLTLYGWLILASLFLGHLTGLGGIIGGRGVEIEGGKGFMIGANEVGLMLLLTAPFVGADMIGRFRSVWLGGVTQVIVYAIAGWHVFTKSSLIAILTSAFSVYRVFIRLGQYAKWVVRFLLFTVSVFLLLQILKSLDAIQAFALDTFFAALLNDGLIAFLFRGRQDYISAIYPQLVEHDLSALFLLFGAGEFFIRELSIGPLILNQGEGTTFEMDLFDLVGAYGVVGMLLFFAVVTTMLRKAGPKSIPLDIKIAIFFVLVHAFMAGHVFFSPQVTTLVAMVLLYFCDDGGKILSKSDLQQKKISYSI